MAGVILSQSTAERVLSAVKELESTPKNRRGAGWDNRVGGDEGGATRMKIKTAADASGMIVCNTWDGTTLGSTDISVRAATGKGKAGEQIWAIPAGPDAGIADVLWIEVAIGRNDSPTNLSHSTGITAESTTWSRQTDGTPLVDTRLVWVEYDQTGHILYGFTRDYTYDTQGRLISISAETRYTIDTLEDCLA